ncbi:MAG: hypothetical protein OEY33_08805, partial [Bdellovibrionales bacterium]|nr:hypothetical protein [Bdellovibrionales bacterium]
MRKTFNKLFLLFLVIGNITFNVCSAQPENDNNVDDERVEIDPDSDLSDDAIASASDSGKIQSGYQYVFGGASDLIGKGLFQNKTLAEYLFNSVANYSYSYNPVQYSIVPSVVNFGFGLNGGVSRNVIKNKDIYNSYSVIDKVYFKAGPSVGASYMGLSASLGLSFGFDYFNINIVKRRKRTEVLPLNQIEGKFKKAFKKESLKVKSKKEIEEENSKYSNFVDLTKAPKKYDVYLGRLWNPITMVFQLPLHYKMAKRMDDYEITSYSLNGGVSMGLGFSGGNIPGLDITKFGANLSIYFNGEHRVTVLKEKPEKPGDSFVRVMVSRKLNRGMGLSVGSTDDMLSGVVTTDNFAGNLGWNLFKGILDIKPFQFRMDKTWGNFYDTVYRYNLNTVEG